MAFLADALSSLLGTTSDAVDNAPLLTSVLPDHATELVLPSDVPVRGTTLASWHNRLADLVAGPDPGGRLAGGNLLLATLTAAGSLSTPTTGPAPSTAASNKRKNSGISWSRTRVGIG